VRVTLRRWLDADARILDVLSDQELEQLRAALVTARKGQAAALAAASEEALRQMPRLVRLRITEILGR
jgi:hypothetical protein